MNFSLQILPARHFAAFAAKVDENVLRSALERAPEIEALLAAELSLTEALYFAAMSHLIFLKIHPFEDGNGRTARLLEKWFLAEKIGEKAWNVASEKHCCQNLTDYYRNAHIGFGYESLDYGRCLPLLCMLPETGTSQGLTSSAALGVFTYGMYTSLIEIQAIQNIYHLVTPELQSGESQDTHLPHLSSLQNIRIKRPDVDVLQR